MTQLYKYIYYRTLEFKGQCPIIRCMSCSQAFILAIFLALSFGTLQPPPHMHYIAISTSCNFHEADKCCTHSQQSDQLTCSLALYIRLVMRALFHSGRCTRICCIVICRAIISALSCSSSSRRIVREEETKVQRRAGE